MKRILCILAALLLLCGCERNIKPVEPPTVTTAPPVFTQPEPAETAVPCSARYIQTNGYHEGVSYPQGRVIRSKDALLAYEQEYKDLYDLESGFRDAADGYDETYFQENALIIVVLQESSGSIRHEITGITAGPESYTVAIDRILPEVGDCAMAQWHILAQIPADPAAPDTVRVELTDIPPARPQLIGISRTEAPGAQPPLWGIRLTARDISPTGLTVVCTRTDDSLSGTPKQDGSSGTGDAMYADTASFTLERLEDGAWAECYGQLADPPARIELQPDGVTQWTVNWKDELPEGQYRVGVNIDRGAEAETFYAGFEILTVTGDTQITMDAENVRISLPWLPDWEYALEYPTEGCVSWGIQYRPQGENGWVRYHYFPRFGVCGTGLETRPYNGGSMGTYDGREIWAYIAFPAGDGTNGCFVAATEQVEPWWPEHGETAMEILDGAQAA